MYCRFMSLTEKLGIPCRYFWYTQKKLYIFCRVQIISVGIFLTHRKIMRKNQRAKIYRSPNIRRQAKTQKIRFSAKRKKKRPTARTWSTVRCICLASKKQVQCSPVGGGQLVPCIDFDRLHPGRIPDESRPPRAADQEQPSLWTVLQRCCRTTVAADVLKP